MPNNGYGYQYLPEMQGLTDVQQQDFSSQMGKQRGMLGAAAGRSGQQSGGSYYGALSNLGAQETRGLSQIERENQLKNAMLAREDRVRQENYSWQEKMADAAYRRQLAMYQTQQKDAQQNALMGGLGSLAGMVASPLISAGFKGMGIGVSPFEKLYNKMPDWQLMQMMSGGNYGQGGQLGPGFGGEEKW